MDKDLSMHFWFRLTKGICRISLYFTKQFSIFWDHGGSYFIPIKENDFKMAGL